MKSFSRLIGCAGLLLTTGIILIALQLYARSDMASKMDDQYVVGVVATASEDEWHAMVLESILDAAAAQGFDVITLHSARSTDAQAEQVRALIIYQVDAIVLAPVAETGWDYVFQEAHDAGIPIITVNKRASTPQEDLVSYVGYDYAAAGHDAALAYLTSPGEHDGNVVELCGTVDASFTREITGGFGSGLRQMDSPLRINYSVSTEFMRSRAKEVIEWLASNRYEMDVILTHSDGITIGAVEALEATGGTPGDGVQIYAFGGSQQVLQMQRDGKISWLAYLDPVLLGEQTVAEVQERLSGATPEERLCPVQILSKGGQ